MLSVEVDAVVLHQVAVATDEQQHGGGNHPDPEDVARVSEAVANHVRDRELRVVAEQIPA